MTTVGNIVMKISIPLAVHKALQEAAATEDRSMASAVRIAIKRYIENPEGTPANSVKEVAKPKPADGLTPQQRTAKTKAEQKARGEEEKLAAYRIRFADYPETDDFGYETHRPGYTTWDPYNPPEGFTVRWATFKDRPDLERRAVLVPLSDYDDADD